MTLTAPTSLTSGGDATNATSYTTASVTPTANRLCLLAVANAGNGIAGAIPTVTGAGLTWVQVATQLCSDNLRRVSVFRALGGSPSTGALTIDFGGVLQLRGMWALGQWGSDVDSSGTNGSGAIVQTGANNTTGVPTTFTVTLAAFGNAANGCYGVICLNNQGQTITPGSGFTQLHNVQAGTETQQLATEYFGGNDTSVDWSLSGGASVAFGLAVEIKAAATGFVPFTGALTTSGSVALSPVTQSLAPVGALLTTGGLALRVGGVLRLELAGTLTTAGATSLTITVTRALESEGGITFRGSAYLSTPVTPVSAGQPTYRVENSLTRQLGAATWSNVMTDRLQAAIITRGRPDELSGTTAGTMTLTFDNDDGNLDLSNPAALWAGFFDGAYPVRIVAAYGGIDYYLGTGYVESLDHVPRGAYGADKVVHTVDAFKELGQAQPVAWDFASQGAAAGLFADGTMGERIDDLLDAVPYAVLGERDLGTGTYPVREERISNTPFLQLIDWMCKLERIGVFIVRGNGDVVFNDLARRNFQSSRGTFGIGTGAVPVASYTVTEANRGIYNEVHVYRSTYSDQDQVATDGGSILRYGRSVYTLDTKAANQLGSDTEALQWAQDFLVTYSKPRYRIDSVTIDPQCGAMSDEAWWHVLDTEIGDRITLALPLSGSSGVVHEDYHVEGLEHRISFKGLQHTVTWRLSKRAGTVGFL